MKKLLQSEVFRYVLVGGSNTAICWVLSFLLPYAGLGYWTISAVTMVFGAVYTYLLNRRYTFRRGDIAHKKAMPKFILNISICYVLSYVLLKPFLNRIAPPDFLSTEIWTGVTLIIANVVYIILNYVGQKFFAFRK